MSPDKASSPKAEIERLRAKMGQIPDRDVRAAIQARIDELTAKLEVEPPVEEVAVPSEPPPPPTPAQAEEAEKLIRHAMLEKRRGNAKAATELLQKAVEVAPGAPAVLEALGDDFNERRRGKEALEMYARAKALDPKNVGLERKHAELVLRVGMSGSIEDQLRAGLSDPFLLSRGDAVASLGTARLLSFVLPGVGHLILGKTVAGFAFLAAWIGSLIWIILERDDLKGLTLMAAGRSAHIGAGVFVPLFIAAVTLISAVGSLGAEKSAARAKKVDRPVPPMNLPFE